MGSISINPTQKFLTRSDIKEIMDLNEPKHKRTLSAIMNCPMLHMYRIGKEQRVPVECWESFVKRMITTGGITNINELQTMKLIFEVNTDSTYFYYYFRALHFSDKTIMDISNRIYYAYKDSVAIDNETINPDFKEIEMRMLIESLNLPEYKLNTAYECYGAINGNSNMHNLKRFGLNDDEIIKLVSIKKYFEYME